VPTILADKQVVDILHAPDDDTPQALRDRAILELLYAAGLRLSELVALNVRSVDLRAKEVRVWGKGNKERIALMGRPAAEAVARYLEEGRPALVKRPGEEALFLNKLGGRLSARGVQIMLRRCALKAGLDERVFPHLLRHTFATHMLDGDADLRVVQELLGHASVSSTQIYTQVSEVEKRKRYLQAFYNVSRTRRR
jgi:integrase/recombinase XerC